MFVEEKIYVVTSKILLGSKSPRRAELLSKAGFKFEQINYEVDETWPEEIINEAVPAFLAKKKADHYRSNLKPNELLITADSVVILNNKIIGKPEDVNDAKEILSRLSGNKHMVITGVSLTTMEKSIVFDECTEVYFDVFTAKEIDYYIEQYKPFDKAGAYGIQEWVGLCKVYKINGTFSNVMGLPVQSLYKKMVTELPEFLPLPLQS